MDPTFFVASIGVRPSAQQTMRRFKCLCRAMQRSRSLRVLDINVRAGFEQSRYGAGVSLLCGPVQGSP